jgi:predicted dehydrogenase
VKVYRKLEEVLADPDVEAVDLCTPTPLHLEQAIAALRAGKHVLCEKPLARTSSQAQQILEAMNASGKFLMPAMCMRFWPGWAWLKDVVQQQRYGKVHAARFRRVSEMPGWGKATYAGGQDMGGALFDLHIHDTDFVQFLFGVPKSVFATGVSLQGQSFDHVVTQYLYPEGPAVTAEGGWLLAKGFNMAYTLLCEKATLDFDLSRGAQALQIIEAGAEPKVVATGPGDGYSEEVRYFIDCLLNRRAPSTVTCTDAVNALRICEAEERSARTGQPQAV